ncbi:MAG: adenylosuccinate synthetase [Sphingobacterium sp.]
MKSKKGSVSMIYDTDPAQLVMTKADVLSGLNKIYVCTHYNYQGKIIDYIPFGIAVHQPEPVFKEIEGWDEDITTISEIKDIPTKLQEYIRFLEAEVGVPM